MKVADKRGAGAEVRMPRDLADFHLRWGEFRPHAAALLARTDLTDSQRGTLQWLVELADRIGQADIDTASGPGRAGTGASPRR